MLVSVIIPAYNDEKYIFQCLDSIVSQTYKNIEIIVVIDGATDRTEEIVKQYAARDNRFKVFIQENAGAAAARNRGLAMASGEYIIFVDSDDWLNEHSIEVLTRDARRTNSDLIVAGFSSIEYIKKKINKTDIRLDRILVKGVDQVRRECLNLLINGIGYSVTGKLYKKSIIDKYNIRFPNKRRAQDTFFNIEYFSYIDSLSVLDECIYNYRNPAYVACWEKDKMGRRYEKKYSEALSDHLSTLLEIQKKIRDKLNEWNLQDNMIEVRLNNELIFGIESLLEEAIKRDYKVSLKLIDKMLREPFVKEAFANSKTNNFYYKMFIFLCKLSLKKMIVLIVMLKAKIRKYFPMLIIMSRKNKRNISS